MTLYNQKAVDYIFDIFEKRTDFVSYTIEGVLLDNHILQAKGMKTIIIKEVYLNEWSSAYSIKKYNKIPQKYQKVIDLLEDDREQEAIKLFFK